MTDIKGRTSPDEIKNDPDFKRAHKLAEEISTLVKKHVLAHSKKPNADLDYIIKTGIILFMAEMFSNLSQQEAAAFGHFDQVMSCTASTIKNAYKFKSAH